MFRPSRLFRALALVLLGGCYAATVEPTAPSYHNPLDLVDAGTGPSDGGQASDGGPLRSTGSVDGLSPNLFAATYFVEVDDAGIGRTSLYVTDVPDLCTALASDAGLGDTWSLLRFRIEGDSPGTYTVAPIPPPNGAIAEFDDQLDGGGFGTQQATSGSLVFEGVDPSNAQSAVGSYTLAFEGTDSLSGSFVATPCALVPPAPGG